MVGKSRNISQDQESVTPERAGVLAEEAVKNYLSDCNVSNGGEVSNCLVALISIASSFMAYGDGGEFTIARLLDVAKAVDQHLPKESMVGHTIQ